MGEGSRSRNGGGVPKEGKRKRGRHRKSGGGGKWVGSWKILSPATADGTRVGGGRRGKGKVRVAVNKSDVAGDKRIGDQLLPSGRNGGRTKNYSQRFTQRIGHRVKPQSGGRFGQGAATAGDVRLGNFRKRPDQQREGPKSKNQLSR